MVQKLRQSGMTQKQVSDCTGVSERTVRRIDNETEITDPVQDIRRDKPAVGRPSKLTPYEAQIRQWLDEPRNEQDGPIKGTEIFARLRELGYTGGKTAVYTLLRQLRPQQTPKAPVVRFEGLPGEFSQHDFGQRKVTYTDGSTETVRFFASRLKYSRFVDVQVVPDEKQETLVRSLLRAFEHFGGVPLWCVFDNLKAAVDSREIQEDGRVKVKWQPAFADLAINCGFIPTACWPYRPQQKGSVENLVGFVKGNFFCGRTFTDRQDLKRQLAAWVERVNTKRPCAATQEIPAILHQRESLQPLKYQAATYAFRTTAVVRPTARVRYENCDYSVPAAAIGQAVTLQIQEEKVAIYLGERQLAEHPRIPENGRSSVLPEHAQEMFVFKRAKPYAQRQLLLDLDPGFMEPYLTELVHRRPHSWDRDVDQMFALYESIGRTDFLTAVALAIEERCFGAEYLLAISRLDTTAMLQEVGS